MQEAFCGFPRYTTKQSQAELENDTNRQESIDEAYDWSGERYGGERGWTAHFIEVPSTRPKNMQRLIAELKLCSYETLFRNT